MQFGIVLQNCKSWADEGMDTAECQMVVLSNALSSAFFVTVQAAIIL